MDNCTSVTKDLLAITGVKFTAQCQKDSILSHLGYPNPLYKSNALSKYEIKDLKEMLN